MQRLAGQQALMAGVPVVELDELGRVELGPHQLLLHRLLGLPGGVAGEAVVLVVEAGQVALHPVVEDGAGELVLQEGLDVLRLLHLGLDRLVVVVGDLLGDQRGDDLPADLRQLARGEVGLQRPLVGAPLVSRGARGDAGLVLLRMPAMHLQDVGGDLGNAGQDRARRTAWSDRPCPRRPDAASALGIGSSGRGDGVGDIRGERSSRAVRQVGVELGVLVLVQVELALPGRAGLGGGGRALRRLQRVVGERRDRPGRTRPRARCRCRRSSPRSARAGPG